MPLRLEIGPKDLEKNSVMFVRRDTGQKTSIKNDEMVSKVELILQEIHDNLYNKAKELLTKNVHDVNDYAKLKQMIDNNGGFVKASWCGDMECETKIKEETGADIRVIPFNKDSVSQCIYCKKEGRHVVYFARGY